MLCPLSSWKRKLKFEDPLLLKRLMLKEFLQRSILVNESIFGTVVEFKEKAYGSYIYRPLGYVLCLFFFLLACIDCLKLCRSKFLVVFPCQAADGFSRRYGVPLEKLYRKVAGGCIYIANSVSGNLSFATQLLTVSLLFVS